jgi:hypothetical protein
MLLFDKYDVNDGARSVKFTKDINTLSKSNKLSDKRVYRPVSANKADPKIISFADYYWRAVVTKPLRVEPPSSLRDTDEDYQAISSAPKEIWHPSLKAATKLNLVLLR